MTSLTQLVLNRQLFGHNFKAKQMMSSIIESHPLYCDYMKTFNSTINYMDIDSIDYKFLLMGYSDGMIEINEISDQNTGQYNLLIAHKFKTIPTVNRCQWYSIDSGMFAITSTKNVFLIDTNTMQLIDTYSLSGTKVYWSDWNPNQSTTIAVGCSSSTIRLIDIRSGSSLQHITCSSLTGSANHNITRIVWSPLDSDCLIAGDSSGYFHIFDIRRPNRCLRVVGNDYTNCEPITCLQFTRDKMSILSSHGVSNKLNLWHFLRSDLINSNINFECPIVRSKQSKHSLNSSYLRCQIFATEDYVFSPTEQKQFGRDVISYDMTTGMKVHSLSTAKEGSFNSLGPNCVTGLDNGSLVLYSGGNKRLCVWTPKVNFEQNINDLKKYYCDEWSDGE